MHVLVLVIGFWASLIAPVDLAAPPLCSSGAAIPMAESLHVWVGYQPAVGIDSPAAKTIYYLVGPAAPGQQLRVPIVTGAVGWGQYRAVTHRIKNDTWGCWTDATWVYSDTIRVTGDLNGDGAIDVGDVAIFTGLLQKGSPCIFPAPAGPTVPVVRLAAPAVRARTTVTR
jgi:hypothetical protein